MDGQNPSFLIGVLTTAGQRIADGFISKGDAPGQLLAVLSTLSRA